MFQVDDDAAETVRGKEIERRRKGGAENEKREEKSPGHGSVVCGDRGLLLRDIR